MACSHGHNHASAAHMTDGRLRAALVATLAFVAVELFAGLRAHSLALLSDAGHNFADGFALLLSWYALRLSRRPSSASKTYGYHRAGILAALANAVLLLVIA